MLLLCFFVRCVFFAPLTVFRKFDFTVNFFLVFARPIVHALTGRAGHFNELGLRHM